VLGNLPSRFGRGPSGRRIANRAGGSPLAPRPRHACICKWPVERSGRSRRWEQERRCRDRRMWRCAAWAQTVAGGRRSPPVTGMAATTCTHRGRRKPAPAPGFARKTRLDW